MKRQVKTLIGMAVFLLILLLIVGLINLRVQTKSSNLSSFSPQNTRNAPIFMVDMDEIASIELTTPTQMIVLEPVGERWGIANTNHPTVDSAVAELVRAILSLHIVQTLPLQTDLSPLGLGESLMSIELHLKNQQILLLRIGSQAPSGQTFYAQLSDNPTPILLASTTIYDIMRPLSFFIDTQLPTIDAMNMAHIHIENRYGIFSAYTSADQRFGARFTMSYPFPSITLRTDRFDQGFLGLWEQRTPINVLYDYESSPEPLTFYGLDIPLAIVKLQDQTGSLFHIAIGKRSSPNSYYAKELNKPAVWELPSDLAESVVNFNSWNMINLFLVRFDNQKIDTIIFSKNTLHHDLKFIRDEKRFTMNTEPINNQKVEAILKNILALSYSGVHTSPVGDVQPSFTITIINDFGLETWEFFPLQERSNLAVQRNGSPLSLTITLASLQQLWNSVNDAL